MDHWCNSWDEVCSYYSEIDFVVLSLVKHGCIAHLLLEHNSGVYTNGHVFLFFQQSSEHSQNQASDGSASKRCFKALKD